MRVLGHIIVRLVQIAIGYVLGIAAAALLLALSIEGCCLGHGGGLDGVESGVITAIGALVAAGVLSIWLAAFAAIPAGIAIALAEAARLRGLVSNLLLGGTVAAATGWLAAGEPGPDPKAMAAVLAAGFAGGLAYWTASGRFAGSLLGEGKAD